MYEPLPGTFYGWTLRRIGSWWKAAKPGREDLLAKTPERLRTLIEQHETCRLTDASPRP